MLKQFFICVLLFIGCSQKLSAQLSIHDSLRFCLTHFHKKTFDNDFKKEIEKVQLLLSKDIPKDSLILALIDLEEQLITVMDENSMLNMHPFKYQVTTAFSTLLISLCAGLPPKNEHPYNATSINNLEWLWSEGIRVLPF